MLLITQFGVLVQVPAYIPHPAQKFFIHTVQCNVLTHTTLTG